MRWGTSIGLFVVFCGIAFWAGETDGQLLSDFLLFSVIPAMFFILFFYTWELAGKTHIRLRFFIKLWLKCCLRHKIVCARL